MLVFFYLLKNVQSEQKILQSKRNTSIKVSEIQDWDFTILFTKTLLTGADCDTEEESITVLVTQLCDHQDSTAQKQNSTPTAMV